MAQQSETKNFYCRQFLVQSLIDSVFKYLNCTDFYLLSLIYSLNLLFPSFSLFCILSLSLVHLCAFIIIYTAFSSSFFSRPYHDSVLFLLFYPVRFYCNLHCCGILFYFLIILFIFYFLLSVSNHSSYFLFLVICSHYLSYVIGKHTDIICRNSPQSRQEK